MAAALQRGTPMLSSRGSTPRNHRHSTRASPRRSSMKSTSSRKSLRSSSRVHAVARVALAVAFCAVQSGCDTNAHASGSSRSDARANAAGYSGTNSRGIPRYVNRPFTDEERAILRRAFGVVNPSHLYVSDSTDEGVLKYDPEIKRCPSCYVNSFRLGYISVRNRGESWDDLELRVKRMRRSDFPPGSLVASKSIDMLDPEIQPEVRQMLADAGRAGFQVHVGSTYRSPEQEAMVMAGGGGRTHTRTSPPSHGRASYPN